MNINFMRIDPKIWTNSDLINAQMLANELNDVGDVFWISTPGYVSETNEALAMQCWDFVDQIYDWIAEYEDHQLLESLQGW